MAGPASLAPIGSPVMINTLCVAISRYTTKGTQTGGFMTNSDTHPQINISDWNDSLPEIRRALEIAPKAQTLTIAYGEAKVTTQELNQLIGSLDSEKIAAVELFQVAPYLVSLLTADEKQTWVTRITQPVSVFKAPLLRNYVEAISEELEGKASPSDISVILNRLGFSSARLFIEENTESRTFDSIHNNEREWDAYIAHLENDWESYGQSPLVYFSDVISTGIPSVLIDASSLEPAMNGTARNALTFLEILDSRLNDGGLNWRVTAVIPKESFELFGVKFKNIDIAHDISSLRPGFSLGFSLTPINTVERCLLLSKYCVKWAVQHLDIIALRSLPFLSQKAESRRAIELYLENADHVFFISNSAKQDAVNYFGLQKDEMAENSVIHLGNSLEDTRSPQTSSTENYVLVLGNDYPHKQVDMAIDALCKAGMKVRSLSSSESHSPLHKPIPPGTLSDHELSRLIEDSAAVVFPSLYEGYGLPIAEAAAKGKQVILWETSVSREISSSLGTEEFNYFCSTPDELVQAVSGVVSHPRPVSHRVRTMTEYNNELINSLEEIFNNPINTQLITRRWKLFNLLGSVIAQAKQETISTIAQQHWRTKVRKIVRKNVR